MNQNEFKSVSFDEFTEHLGASECFDAIAFCGELDLTDNKFQADLAIAEVDARRQFDLFRTEREQAARRIVRRPGYRYHLDFEFPLVYTQLELF